MGSTQPKFRTSKIIYMSSKTIIISLIFLVSSITIITGVSLFSKKNEIRNHIIEYKRGHGGNSPSSIDMYENLEKYSDSFQIPKYIIYNIAFKETHYRGPFDWKYRPGTNFLCWSGRSYASYAVNRKYDSW